MKNQKVLLYDKIVAEIRQNQQISQNFQPSRKVIKQCVEELIDRQYLQRQKNSPQLIEYIP